MEAVVLLLALVNLAQVGWVFRPGHRATVWLLPTTAWLIIGFLNYPARALLLLALPAWNDYQLEPGEIALALTFYTAFTTLLLAVFRARLGRVELPEGDPAEWSRSTALVVLFLFMAASFGYRLYTGRSVYALYDSMEDLRLSTQDNLWGLALNLKWLVIPWAWLAWARSGRRRFLAIGLASLALVVALAIISTGKGDLLNLVILYLAGMAYLRQRSSRVVVAIGVAAGVAFGVYSYLARAHSDVRGEFSLARVYSTMDAVESNADVGTDAALRQLVSRFSYLDGLVLCSRGTRLPDGAFVAGSLPEVVMLVPRSLWPGRPFLSFNHFMTESVWGMPVFSETPVGRAGEAYFVLGLFGVALGAVYGVLWSWIVRILLLKPGRWRNMLYFLVLFSLLLPDAYFLYGMKPFVYLSPLLVLGYQLDLAEQRWWRQHHLWQRRLQP